MTIRDPMQNSTGDGFVPETQGKLEEEAAFDGDRHEGPQRGPIVTYPI